MAVVFLLLEFAASLTVISKREKFGNLLREIDRELELINRSSLRNITETLVMTLMISLLYTYLILTLYYVLLMDGENTFTRLMSTIGKVMIFVTLGIYVVAQYYFSTHEMFLVIQRLAILLFILSVSNFSKKKYFYFFLEPVNSDSPYCHHHVQQFG